VSWILVLTCLNFTRISGPATFLVSYCLVAGRGSLPDGVCNPVRNVYCQGSALDEKGLLSKPSSARIGDKQGFYAPKARIPAYH